jgi:hypothetical protein
VLRSGKWIDTVRGGIASWTIRICAWWKVGFSPGHQTLVANRDLGVFYIKRDLEKESEVLHGLFGDLARGEKIKELAGLTARGGIRWHLVERFNL